MDEMNDQEHKRISIEERKRALKKSEKDDMRTKFLYCWCKLLAVTVQSPSWFLASKGGEFGEHIGDIPSVYKLEMMNRVVHAAARRRNLKILKELLDNCTTDVLACRDKQGGTILHAAAGRGQVEVVKYLMGSYDITDSTDHQGKTALHVAAYRGQPAAVEALILASPSMISLKDNAGETFLHATVSVSKLLLLEDWTDRLSL